MYQMEGCKRKIDLLSEELFREEKIPVTQIPLCEILVVMSNKVDVTKFLQSIVTLYMEHLTLIYPLPYVKRLVI